MVNTAVKDVPVGRIFHVIRLKRIGRIVQPRRHVHRIDQHKRQMPALCQLGTLLIQHQRQGRIVGSRIYVNQSSAHVTHGRYGISPQSLQFVPVHSLRQTVENYRVGIVASGQFYPFTGAVVRHSLNTGSDHAVLCNLLQDAVSHKSCNRELPQVCGVLGKRLPHGAEAAHVAKGGVHGEPCLGLLLRLRIRYRQAVHPADIRLAPRHAVILHLQHLLRLYVHQSGFPVFSLRLYRSLSHPYLLKAIMFSGAIRPAVCRSLSACVVASI